MKMIICDKPQIAHIGAMRFQVRQWLLILLSAAPGLFLTGCGHSTSASNHEVPADIQGELISAAPTAKPEVAKATPAISPASAPAAARTVGSSALPLHVVARPPASALIPVESKPASIAGNYQPVGFDKLASYVFEVADDAPVTNTPAVDKADDQIPGIIKAFDHKKVSIRGFMLPLKVESGKVTEFLIMKDQSLCCYGATPKINEWVSVKLNGSGIKPVMDQPVSMEGTLHVGAMRENGYLVGIYQMDGDKLIESDN
jgi:hypothetical protein